MTSLFLLLKPMYPQSFVFIYGFLFLVVGVESEQGEEEKTIIAQYIYDGEDLGHPHIQSTAVCCNVGFCDEERLVIYKQICLQVNCLRQ